jgi:hypothetical protein
VPGQMSALYQHLQPAVVQSGGHLDRAIEAHAREQADLLRMSSPVIREAIKAGNSELKRRVIRSFSSQERPAAVCYTHARGDRPTINVCSHVSLRTLCWSSYRVQCYSPRSLFL